MTTISIAMATYNGERHIREQLDSLARQTSLPYELVVTDDGSTDSTLSIVENFVLSAPFPVRIYRNKERLNYTKKFLYAASLCQGEWIAFCDQDDVWLDHKLAVVSNRIKDHADALLVIHSGLITNEQLAPTGIRVPEFSCDNSVPPLHKSEFMGYAMTFRSDLLAISNIVRYPTDDYYELHRCGHDRYVFMLANAFGDTVQISECLVIYRRHSHAVSRDYQYGDALHESFVGKQIAKVRTLKTARKQETFMLYGRWQEWAEILSKSLFQETIWRRRAEEASKFYGNLSSLFGARTKLYDKNRLDRLRGFPNLIKLSAYRSKKLGGFGVLGFISDVLKIMA